MDLVKPILGKLRQYGSCVIAAAVGIGITVASTAVIVQRDDIDAEHQFHVLAENYFMVLQNGVNEYVNRLKAVRALFDSSAEPVTRNEFEAFAQPLLRENAAITTLSWVPRVPNDERAEHEREGLLAGLPDYHIKDIDAQGRMTVSPRRSMYYPIFYATLPNTSPLYGLDLRSEPETLVELRHLRDEDRLGFSAVPKLVSTGGKQGGFLFSLPIYKPGSAHNSIEDRRRNLAGFVHGSLITAKMVNIIITESNTPKGLDLFFFMPGIGTQAMPYYMHPSRFRTSPLASMSRASAAAGSSWSRDLMADGQPWLTMIARPMPGGPLIAHYDRAWIVLTFGLILTGVLLNYMQLSRRHAMGMLLANKKVSELAQMDALTSLANRRAFVERLQNQFASCRRGGKPFAIHYFDLDHFKDVNDTLGHAVGDGLLRQVAARVKSIVRANDVIARFGGDEFAILQSDVENFEAVGALAAKIGRVLAEPYVFEGNEIHISASTGISRYSPEVAGPDAMMIQADLALYRAKEDGRNAYRFHNADLDRQVEERVVIADELRGAVGREELELYYQPEVEMRSGRIIGLEALLRWNHPKRGQMSPSVFIAIAERSGQIQMLGQWVLDAACRQLRLWRDAGVAPDLVGVNVSALDFKGSTELDQLVSASLDKWGVPAGMIEIELTESVLMDVTQQHHARFQHLRQLGVRIAVDDFGTGYSSLSYLANYPINRVKIARQLMSGVDTESRSAAVVRAAIRLAHELSIEIVAEGIETEGQATFLLSAGCEYGQGLYFSEPVNAEQATALLRLGTIRPDRKALHLVETHAA
jgi:diguanylate cyclase (GGDEF)-like protein